MQLSHINLPSFTLVLTSGHGSLYLPVVSDHLMKTIDLRYVPDNFAYFEDQEFTTESMSENFDTQTIFESERPTACGAKQTKGSSIKQNLINKFFTPKSKSTRN